MKRKAYQTARCILYQSDYQGERFLLADHRGAARRRSTARRARARAQGNIKWGLPGGHIEWREAPVDAARREIQEELDLTLGALTSVGDYTYKQRLHAVFAAPSDVDQFDLEFSELAEVRWFTLPEITHLRDFDQLHAGYEHDAVCALINLLQSSP